MCNLYNITTNREAIRVITRAMIDHVSNLQPSLDDYPDREAPAALLPSMAETPSSGPRSPKTRRS